MWTCCFVGADGHPSVDSRAHLVSPSLDPVCPYVGLCCDMLGPAQLVTNVVPELCTPWKGLYRGEGSQHYCCV